MSAQLLVGRRLSARVAAGEVLVLLVGHPGSPAAVRFVDHATKSTVVASQAR